MSITNNYYIKNNTLFIKQDLDEQLQKDAQTANTLGTQLLTQNTKAYQLSLRDWKDKGEIVGGVSQTLNDPWFWTTMILINNHGWNAPHGGGGCSGSSDCGGCGGGGKVDGEACLIAVLILTIAALIIAVVALLGLACSEAGQADQIRQQINKMKEEQQKLQQASKAANQVYDAIIPILRNQYKSKIAETLCTVTIVIGVSFLTASACVALYSVINQLPMSSLATPFAIAGGSVVGAGIMAHLIRPLARMVLEDSKNYEKLHEALQKCRQSVANPYDILNQEEEEKVYLKLGNWLFLKKGKYLPIAQENHLLTNGYTKIEIETRQDQAT